jgi:hypothetical protein
VAFVEKFQRLVSLKEIERIEDARRKEFETDLMESWESLDDSATRLELEAFKKAIRALPDKVRQQFEEESGMGPILTSAG